MDHVIGLVGPASSVIETDLVVPSDTRVVAEWPTRRRR